MGEGMETVNIKKAHRWRDGPKRKKFILHYITIGQAYSIEVKNVGS